MSALLWFAMALLALLLGFAAAGMFLQSRRRDTQDDILARLQFGVTPGDAQWSNPVQVKNPVLRVLCQRIWQAGFELSVQQVMVVLVAAIVIAMLMLLALGLLIGGLLLGFVILALMLLLQQLSGRRQRQIVMQLPDFLEHALRALTAGNTLEEAFAEAARECPEPSRALFLGVSRQVRLGAPIEDTLAQAAEVHELPDIQVLAMAARVNRRYGGSIRNMIKSLIQVIRARGTAARELRALTAETRFSALLLFLIPLGITVFILLRSPGFYNDMWSDGFGRLLLLAAAALQFIGGLVIWRMLRATEAGA